VLLLALTVVTGLVDAVSVLHLGRVFVANMTGNVVFLGFAAAGAPGFSFVASLIAVGGFLLGAGVGGPMAARFDNTRRNRMLGVGTLVQLALVLPALVIAALADVPIPTAPRYAMAGLLATAMGLQNATVRRLGVPDMTTTVLTMALTGVAADIRSGNSSALTRRVLSVVAMFAGATVGAALVLHSEIPAALALAVVLLVAVIVLALHDARCEQRDTGVATDA
jgi:uncharacterized membrane protein YoaK (UPF0700 family)